MRSPATAAAHNVTTAAATAMMRNAAITAAHNVTATVTTMTAAMTGAPVRAHVPPRASSRRARRPGPRMRTHRRQVTGCWQLGEVEELQVSLDAAIPASPTWAVPAIRDTGNGMSSPAGGPRPRPVLLDHPFQPPHGGRRVRIGGEAREGHHVLHSRNELLGRDPDAHLPDGLLDRPCSAWGAAGLSVVAFTSAVIACRSGVCPSPNMKSITA